MDAEKLLQQVIDQNEIIIQQNVELLLAVGTLLQNGLKVAADETAKTVPEKLE